MAGRLEHPAEQVPHERAPRVADVERACRIRGHEFDVDAVRRRGRDVAPAVRARQDSADDVRERRVRERQVEEAGRGDRHGPDDGARACGVRGELGGQRFGDPERRHPARPGQLHREVRREVAVLRVRRALDLDRRPLDRRNVRQRAGGRRALPRGPERSTRSRAERHERCWLDGLGHAASRG
ncbi:MAG TPA: hypothetical protein VIK13_16575 [Candidatus Limnocylindrales bacterium]